MILKKECIECIQHNTHYCTKNSKIKDVPEYMFNSAANKAAERYINEIYGIDE